MIFKEGLIIGKFMPFHKGHEFLIRFGMGQCENLTVIVDHIKNEIIDNKIRVEWIKKTFPNINVFTFDDFMPQYPSETNDFWDIWENGINDIINPDVLFASEEYGVNLSKVLNCEFIPCDIPRNNINISATKIKNNIWNNFEYLNIYAKSYYSKNFVFIGPESTYKSTISQKLKNLKYNDEIIDDKLIVIPESAESYIKLNSIDKIEEKHLNIFAFSQQSLSKAILNNNIKPIIIHDSDIVTTIVYYKLMFKKIPHFIIDLFKNEDNNKTYLLFKNDNPYSEDLHRIISKEEEFRDLWFESCKKFLEDNNKDYIIIDGSFNQKNEKVQSYILNIIKENFS